MFSIKGEGRTRPTTRLCDTCDNCHIMKGPGHGDEIVICCATAQNLRLPFPVTECSDYVQKGKLTKYQAEKIGWVIEIKGGRFAGFIPPKKRDDD